MFNRCHDNLYIESAFLYPDIKIVRIKGRFDAHAIDDVEAVVMMAVSKEKQHLLLDMSGVTYMGSGGVRLLLAISHKMKEAKRRFVILGIPESASKILETMEIRKIFNIFQVESEALDFIRNG
jgi:anti-sigma B factor antagonist